MDCDNARGTTITGGKVIPDGYDVDALQHVLIIASRTRTASPGHAWPRQRSSYEDDAETGPLLEIPGQFTDDE